MSESTYLNGHVISELISVASYYGENETLNRDIMFITQQCKGICCKHKAAIIVRILTSTLTTTSSLPLTIIFFFNLKKHLLAKDN